MGQLLVEYHQLISSKHIKMEFLMIKQKHINLIIMFLYMVGV